MASRGAHKVNLWHGVPLKKIERDIEQADHTVNLAVRGSLFQRAILKLKSPELTERYDAILATSNATAERFSSAFGIGRERIIVAGYPRTDGLLATSPTPFLPEADRAMVEEFKGHERAGRRVLFYMPTFRDWGNTADRVIPIDWERLDRALQAHSGVLYCKLHPAIARGCLISHGLDDPPAAQQHGSVSAAASHTRPRYRLLVHLLRLPAAGPAGRLLSIRSRRLSHAEPRTLRRLRRSDPRPESVRCARIRATAHRSVVVV